MKKLRNKEIKTLVRLLTSNNIKEIDILKRYKYKYLEEVPSNLYKELIDKILELSKNIRQDRLEHNKKQTLKGQDFARRAGVHVP